MDPKAGVAIKKMVGVLRLPRVMDRPHRVFYLISKDLISDGINWGRIVVYLIFAAEFALSMKRHIGGDHNVWMVADWTAEFMEVHLKKWVTTNGGWKKGFQEFRDQQVQTQRVLRGNHVPTQNGTLPTAFFSIKECLMSSMTGLLLW
jgi:hypothetical protein